MIHITKIYSDYGFIIFINQVGLALLFLYINTPKARQISDWRHHGLIPITTHSALLADDTSLTSDKAKPAFVICDACGLSRFSTRSEIDEK